MNQFFQFFAASDFSNKSSTGKQPSRGGMSSDFSRVPTIGAGRQGPARAGIDVLTGRRLLAMAENEDATLHAFGIRNTISGDDSLCPVVFGRKNCEEFRSSVSWQ
jgi:hypothetical protein